MANAQYQNVNGVKTLSLHGKNYVEVAERVHMVHEKKAVFSIVKSEPVNVADRWLWVAVIVVDGQQYIGNAEIKMNAPKNTPDGTNPFECGETSAIGRALAFAGFGSVESIASKDEIERSKPYEGTTTQPAKENKPAARPAQVARPRQAATSEQKPVTVPNFAQMRSLAERWYPDGWVGLRRDLIVEFDLGDIADDAWGEDLRKTAYERIKEAKALKEDQPVAQAS